MQDFSVEIHSVESQQVTQVIQSPLIFGKPTITRVPEGSTLCLEKLARKLIMVPFASDLDTAAKRTDEEVQVARRLSLVSSRIYISSTSTLSCIVPTPWLLQADGLLDTNRIKEALALADKASRTIDDVELNAESLVSPSFSQISCLVPSNGIHKSEGSFRPFP